VTKVGLKQAKSVLVEAFYSHCWAAVSETRLQIPGGIEHEYIPKYPWAAQNKYDPLLIRSTRTGIEHDKHTGSLAESAASEKCGS
jgi:hypothetical protein